MGFLHFNQQYLIIYTNACNFSFTTDIPQLTNEIRPLNVNKESLLPTVWQEIVHKLKHTDSSLLQQELILLKETPKNLPFAIGIKKGEVRVLRSLKELHNFYSKPYSSPALTEKQQFRDVS